jgi:hypothetical protein
MSLLSRDAILKAKDLPGETVAVPEWGGSVKVRGMTGADRSLWMKQTMQQQGDEFVFNPIGSEILLVALCVVDGEGKPLFTPADVEALGAKSSAALDRIHTVASRLSGTTAEAAETAVKNSEAIQKNGSGSN